MSMPFQMAATIYFFYWVGTWIDGKYAVESGAWTKGMTIAGVLGSLFQFIRQANKINRNE